MAPSTSSIRRAYDALHDYEGENEHILSLRRRLNEHTLPALTEFDVEYINNNHTFVRDHINRVVSIAAECGQALQSKYDIDFIPKRLIIYDIIGRMGGTYHLWGQFRKSVPPVLMWIKSCHILDDLHPVDLSDISVDFEWFDRQTADLGRSLRAHQKDGVRFLLGNKRCIMADSMGLGKTTQAVVAAIASNSKRVLVIAPATMKTTWRKEIGFYVPTDQIGVVQGSTWQEDKRFTIINFEILKNFYTVPLEPVFEKQECLGADGKTYTVDVPVMIKNRSTGKMEQKMRKSRQKDVITAAMSKSRLFQEKFDCIIIDEAQKLSNSTSMRSKIAEDFIRRSNTQYVFLLTGTPLTNNPKNLYNILRLIGAPVASDYRYYMERYCGARMFKKRDGKEFMKFEGPTNLDELRERIKHLYIRRLISDLPDMVGKTITPLYFDLNPQQMARYSELWEQYLGEKESNGTQEDMDPSDYRQLVEGALVRRFLANEMVPNTIALADSHIENGEKVVIVCTFQDEVDRFRDHYGAAGVVYDGRVVSAKKKDKAIEDFMEDPSVKVFIANINAASTGITLTSAHTMIMNSYSWAEVDNRQMQDRIWRLTQTQDCTIYYMLWTDSVSQDMFEKVIYKGLIMDTVIKRELDK